MSQRSPKKRMEGSDYEDKWGQRADDVGWMSNREKRKISPRKEIGARAIVTPHRHIHQGPCSTWISLWCHWHHPLCQTQSGLGPPMDLRWTVYVWWTSSFLCCSWRHRFFLVLLPLSFGWRSAALCLISPSWTNLSATMKGCALTLCASSSAIWSINCTLVSSSMLSQRPSRSSRNSWQVCYSIMSNTLY